MRKQDTELTELEPLEITAGPQDGTPAGEGSGEQAQGQVSAAQAGGEEKAVESETVPRAEYEKLKAERDQAVDRAARLQAEFENARKRAEREKTDFRDFATGNVVEQFLPVMDNFALALKADGTANQLRSGVELIIKQMEEVLQKMQVTQVPAIGAEFDPRVQRCAVFCLCRGRMTVY